MAGNSSLAKIIWFRAGSAGHDASRAQWARIGTTLAVGAGASVQLIGTDKNDLSDALDRRTQFKVVRC